MAIVTGIKSKQSYTVKKREVVNKLLYKRMFIPKTDKTVMWSKLTYTILFLNFNSQLGPVTSGQILANHTSAVGHVENLNFTLEPTTMSLGCHVDVRYVSAFHQS